MEMVTLVEGIKYHFSEWEEIDVLTIISFVLVIIIIIIDYIFVDKAIIKGE